jgi:hypothetical protein
MTGSKAPRAVLLAVIGLHLVAETSLAPFYPALFRRLFGVTSLEATGGYIWVCRVVAVIALPLWGLAARRWALHRLVVAGLSAAVVLDLALGLAPTFAAFTALSAAVVAAQCSLLLAYPAFVGLDTALDRLPSVRSYVAVFHLAMLGSTLVGAAVMALPQPRVGIAAFAVLDAVLAVACWRLLSGAAAPDAAAVVRPSSVVRGAVLAVAAVGVAFEVAAGVVRPFFTEWVIAGGGSVTASALLFLLPSVGALVVLPLARRCRLGTRGVALPAAFVVAAAGLGLQALSPGLATVALGRILFGAGLGLGQVALDLRMFEVTGTDGPAYAVIETARMVALIATPLLATALVEAALQAPLAGGALLFVVAAVAGSRLTPAPRLVREEEPLALEYAG